MQTALTLPFSKNAILAIFAFSVIASAQPAVEPIKLRDVRVIYVGTFGAGVGADLIRARVITGLVKSGRLEIVESQERCDAILTGAAEVETEQRGERESSRATAAVRLIRRTDKTILWADDASSRLVTLNPTASAAEAIVKKVLAALH